MSDLRSRIPDLRARISEAALVPELWSDVFEEIASSIGAMAFSLGYFGETGFSESIQSRSLDAPLAKFLKTMPDDLTRIRRYVAGGHTGFVVDERIFSSREMSALPLFDDIMRPFGLVGGISMLARMGTGGSAVISFERGADSTAFGSETVNILNELIPNIARSLTVSAQLQFERARTACHALEMIGMPAAFLAAGNRVIARNESFEAIVPEHLLGRDDVLDLYPSRKRSNVDAEWKPQRYLLPFPYKQISEDRVLFLIPVNGKARDLFPDAANMAIVVQISNERVPAPKFLQAHFGITPSEALVARGIAQGLSVIEISKEMSIKKTTVQQHLKSIYRKTGISSQAQLVSKIAWAFPQVLSPFEN